MVSGRGGAIPDACVRCDTRWHLSNNSKAIGYSKAPRIYHRVIIITRAMHESLMYSIALVTAALLSLTPASSPHVGWSCFFVCMLFSCRADFIFMDDDLVVATGVGVGVGWCEEVVEVGEVGWQSGTAACCIPTSLCLPFICHFTSFCFILV